MDKIQKFIRKLTKKESEQIILIIRQIQSGDFSNLDVKKLKRRDEEFRVRKGNIRIFFRRTNKGFDVTDIQWRGSKTYNS